MSEDKTLMRNSFMVLLGLGMALATSVADAQGAVEKRCGWLENPTPANFSLLDRSGEWTISEQGGYQAPGIEKMPDMTTKGWVVTNAGEHGYGCACLDVQVDEKSGLVTRLVSAEPLPLRRCKLDPKLPPP